MFTCRAARFSCSQNFFSASPN